MSQNLSSAAVMIGASRVKIYEDDKEACKDTQHAKEIIKGPFSKAVPHYLEVFVLQTDNFCLLTGN